MKDEQSVARLKKYIEQWEQCARILKESKWPFPQSPEDSAWSMKTRSELEAKCKELEAQVEEYLKLLRQYYTEVFRRETC